MLLHNLAHSTRTTGTAFIILAFIFFLSSFYPSFFPMLDERRFLRTSADHTCISFLSSLYMDTLRRFVSRCSTIVCLSQSAASSKLFSPLPIWRSGQVAQQPYSSRSSGPLRCPCVSVAAILRWAISVPHRQKWLYKEKEEKLFLHLLNHWKFLSILKTSVKFLFPSIEREKIGLQFMKHASIDF